MDGAGEKYIQIQPPELGEAVLLLAERLSDVLREPKPGDVMNTVVLVAYQLVETPTGLKVAFNGFVFGCCAEHQAAQLLQKTRDKREAFRAASPCGRPLLVGGAPRS